MAKKDAGNTVSKKELKAEENTKKTKKKSSSSSKKQQSKSNIEVQEKVSKDKEEEVLELSGSLQEEEGSNDSYSCVEDRKKVAAKNFKVTVSFSLYNKLLSQAEEEGISLDEYAGELLSEGCVVRAWDIESLNHNSSFKNGGNNNYRPTPPMGNGSNFRMNKKSKKGMSQARYQNIMNDKSAFMEYVRRSDKDRRR